MLTATLRWRDGFKVNEVVNEEFPDEVFGKLGYVYGTDKGGRPVTYVFNSFRFRIQFSSFQGSLY
jgi:hypothetical protein